MCAYDIEETERKYEIEGITGHITKYMTVEREYPYLVLDMTKMKMEQYKMKSLNTMFQCVNKYNEIDEANGIIEDRTISIYVTNGEKTSRIGKLHPLQIKAFLNMFGADNITGMLKEGRELTGAYLYVLSE